MVYQGDGVGVGGKWGGIVKWHGFFLLVRWKCCTTLNLLKVENCKLLIGEFYYNKTGPKNKHQNFSVNLQTSLI